MRIFISSPTRRRRIYPSSKRGRCQRGSIPYHDLAIRPMGYLDAGMHLLTKPFPMDTLNRRIRKIPEGE
jgi:hypothetical protein